MLEGSSPSASSRLKALKKINEAGIDTYVCINPLLPHFSANEESLRNLFSAISIAGTRNIFLEHLNLSGNKLSKVLETLRKSAPDKIKYFEASQSEKYKTKLNSLIFRILKDYDFHIELGGIIDHNRKTVVSNSRKAEKLKKGWKRDFLSPDAI